MIYKILLLPGWLNSGSAHWQSHWELERGYERVAQHDWQRPLRGDWITRLEEVVLSIPPHQPILLAAHSLGCHLAAAWAAISRNSERVSGALLVAPPDVSRADFPADLRSWRQAVTTRLPFAASCVASSDDPYASLDVTRRLATTWGADCVVIGDCGHINGDSGLGSWPEGHALLMALKRTTFTQSTLTQSTLRQVVGQTA